MDRPSPNDDELLAELQAAGRLDPAPDDAVAAVSAAFMWRTIDAELAELTYDSALHDEGLTLVRHTETSRFLTFQAADLTLELEASAVGERRRLIGQLVPPQGGVIEIRHRSGSTTVEVDELGRFGVPDLAPGPISLRCRTADGATVSTDWVLV